MKKVFLRFFWGFMFLGIFFFFLILFFPEPNSFSQNLESSKIYDRNGVLLYEILIPERGKQDFVEIEKVSVDLLEAIVAIEDRDFYAHFGVDFSALARAIWQNFYYGEIVSGASTIEQQLARNLLNHQKRTYFNKFKEILLAFKFNLKYEKKEILEKYLNTVYFGNLAYGIETASQTYFGKSSTKLDLAESAYLAGLPQSPSRYSPYVNLKMGKQRQLRVLDALLLAGKIEQEDYALAVAESLNFQKQKLVNLKAPHFVMWILDELEKADLLEKISLGGFEITTTLDLALQEEVENLANLHLDKLKFKNITNTSVIVLNQKNGEILTMLGSRDYFDEEIDGEVNVALALRQPGSTLKPFLYAMLFEEGLETETTILDEAVRFDSVDGHAYEPKNYDLQYHGKVTLRESLAQSLNIPAVKILDFIGVNSFLNKLKDLGIETLNYPSEHYGLALALGSGEVKLLELTQAYGVLGNEGKSVVLQGIGSIENLKNSGKFISNSSEESLFSLKSVNQVTSILTDNYARIPAFGEDNPLKFNYPVAVKTGTSRNFRDNWTLGYTPQFTVGVWVGNSDGSAMIDSSGITGASPLFHSVMNLVFKNQHQGKRTEFALKQNFADEFEKIMSFEVFLESKKIQSKANLKLAKNQKIITYPYDGDVFQLSASIPLEKQVLRFKAKENGKWFLNDEFLGQGKIWDWRMKKGKCQLKYVLPENLEEEIVFWVQ